MSILLPVGNTEPRKISVLESPAMVAKLTTELHSSFPNYVPRMSLADIERFWIISAIEKYPCKKECCQVLGISIKTLYNKVHEYGIWDQFKKHFPKETPCT